MRKMIAAAAVLAVVLVAGCQDTKKVTELQGQIDKLTQQVTDLTGQVAKLTAERDSLGKVITRMTAKGGKTTRPPEAFK